MRIKKISTEQFAGIRNKEIELENGVNIIYGRNESGKSTLVSLISGVLFQNAKIDGRRDKDFKEGFFPAAKKSGTVHGNVIDGTIVIETSDGEYKLAKEWGEDAFSKLSTPDGIVKNQEDINKILNGILGYGEGVYRELLISPQKSAALNLQNLLNDSQKTEGKKELADSVSQAFAESGGVSVETLEQKINEKIDELAGKNWDIENGCPKSKKRAVKSVGEVLKAFYKLEDAQNDQRYLSELEEKADNASREYSKAEKALAEKENERDEFEKYSTQLNLLNENTQKIKRLESDLDRFNDALIDFPKSRELLDRANKLSREKENRDTLDKFSSAKDNYQKLQKINGELSGILCPADTEIREIKSAENEICSLQNKLCGMNISAKIKMLGGNSVVIRSLRTGEILKPRGEKFLISEAVTVEIPGVMKMEMSPADVDAEKINAEISALNSKKSAVLNKYGCRSVNDAEELVKRFNALESDKKILESNLKNVLGGSNYKELENKAGTIGSTREKDVIDGEIFSLCGGNVSGFIGAKTAALDRYMREFGTFEALQIKISDCVGELAKARNSVASAESIPEKYRGVTNPDEYKAILQAGLKAARDKKEYWLAEKAAANTELDKFSEEHENIREDVENFRREYEEKTELLNNWLHIREVFCMRKDSVSENPLQNLADNFGKYLSLISDGRVSTDFSEDGKPDFTITSGGSFLDYGKLSEGTKDTVYLAFRLAALDHLFPRSGGMIVLDDPLNDMDTERVKQSCELIKSCAERHQVILFTCREEYIQLLGGNSVNI